MTAQTKPYVLWQGRVPTCNARLINMLRKENPIICEVEDWDALGTLAWRAAAPHILDAVTAVALVGMREELDARLEDE